MTDQTIPRRQFLLGSALTGAALAIRPELGLGQAVAAVASRPAGNVIRARLALNENAFGCSALAVQAIRDNLADLCRYTEEQPAALTAQIAAKEGVASEQIVLGEILPALGMQLSLDGGAGGEFVYSTPGFTDLVAAAEQTGGVTVAVPLNDRLENDLPALADRVGARTRAVYLVNPHNPSGTVSDAAALKSFAHDVAQRRLVIVDEAYLEFTEDFAERTLVDRVRDGDNVIVFRTFSKIYGLAALQLGYAVAPRALAIRLRQQGVGAPHGLNRLAVVAASAGMRDDAFVARSRRSVAAERQRWNAALEKLGLRRSNSQGNFVFFESGRPHEELATGFRSQGVDIGRSFPPLDHWARISIGLPAENTLAISVLQSLLHR